MRPRVVAIVPSAGSGKRLGLKTKKPFVLLDGKPLVYYALHAINSSRAVDAIIIACEKGCIRRFEKLVSRFRLSKVAGICAGGRTRFQSVKNSLRLVDRSFDIVLIHDGARPFLTDGMISGSVNLARKFGGCIIAVPENDTVKLTGNGLTVKKTLDRSKLYRAQTPQTFRRGLIERAYAASNGKKVTDDASLAEACGINVKILEGSYSNIKITTKEDLKLAEVLI